jgi:hypothetical protein
VVKIRAKTGKEGQTSIDFLTGMTLFLLTLVFVLNSLFTMVQPYTTTADDDVASDRISDELFTDSLTSPDLPPGYLNLTETTVFFERMSEDEIRSELGIPETRNFNITLSSDYTSYKPTERLIAYWPMNERDSREALDVAGRERMPGDIEGNVTTDVRGIFSSGAYSFEGSEAAVNVSNDSLLRPDTEELTLSAWVKPQGSQPPFATIAAKGLDDGYQMHLESGQPVFEKGAGPEAQSSVTLNDGEWYHIVGAYKNESSSDNLKIYVNGASEPSWEGDDNLGAAVGDNLGIGNNLQDPDRHFNGYIDEVRLYDRRLTEDEIKDLYDEGDILTPDSTAPTASDQSNRTLEEVKYTRGRNIPDEGDIASVSSRRRVGYIGEDPNSPEPNVFVKRESTQRVQFPVQPGSDTVGNSLDAVRVKYPSSVDVRSVIEDCRQSSNAQSGVKPPCPGLLNLGIDTDGDGLIDKKGTDNVECGGTPCPITPNPNDGDGVMVSPETWPVNNSLRIELGNGPTPEGGDDIIVEFPLADATSACENADVSVNPDSENNVKALSVCGDRGTFEPVPDIDTIEVEVKVW